MAGGMAVATPNKRNKGLSMITDLALHKPVNPSSPPNFP